VNLRIAAGQHVAFVGASGSGKSTILALISRLHETTAGEVLMDGCDLRRVTEASIRKQTAMVRSSRRAASETLLAGIGAHGLVCGRARTNEKRRATTHPLHLYSISDTGACGKPRGMPQSPRP
jgi:ATP-binding cassette subfamily B protein